MIKLFLTIIVVALLAGVLRAPAFLVCERPLKKADCVIAMLGGDFSERKREVLSLNNLKKPYNLSLGDNYLDIRRWWHFQFIKF